MDSMQHCTRISDLNVTGGRRLQIAAAIAALLLGGCASRPPALPSAESPRHSIRTQVIGRSVQGRDIECLTIGEGPVVVMFVGTIHGDESAGTPLLERLAREAGANPPSDWLRDRTLVIVPLANPDGFALGQRGNARGVDLNRNFPADSFTSRRRHGSEPLSEPESLALHARMMEVHPARIISMHQPLSCIDYDGDGAALASAMAVAIDPVHRLKVGKLGALPGSLGSFAGEDLGIPIITVELGGGDHRLNADELWTRYGTMLIAAVEFN